jgi:hypothetical protein
MKVKRPMAGSREAVGAWMGVVCSEPARRFNARMPFEMPCSKAPARQVGLLLQGAPAASATRSTPGLKVCPRIHEVMGPSSRGGQDFTKS